MTNDSNKLQDNLDQLDPLFQTGKTTPIHGVLKVAGSDEKQVDDKLEAILKELQYDKKVIVDIVNGTSEPASTSKKPFISRIDGKTRDKNGKEQ
jgi:hypothetical protein